jgi:hypothetical protein
VVAAALAIAKILHMVISAKDESLPMTRPWTAARRCSSAVSGGRCCRGQAPRSHRGFLTTATRAKAPIRSWRSERLGRSLRRLVTMLEDRNSWAWRLCH